MSKEYRIKSKVAMVGKLGWFAESREKSIIGKFIGWEFMEGTVALSRTESLSKLSEILQARRRILYLDSDGKIRK